jgi:O-antigen/teichoic acid export membrane protein
LTGKRALQGLLGGSAVLLVIANVANVGHFAFHVLMARLLGPGGYGALAAMVALVSVGYVLTEAAQTVMARYTALAASDGEVRSLLAHGLRHGGRAAVAITGVYLLLAIAIAPLLHVSYGLTAVFALAFASLPLIPVSRGALLGLRRFAGFGWSLLAEVVVKLGCGALALWVAWKELAGAAAVSLSLVAAFACALVPLRGLRRVAPEPAAAHGGAFAYGVPVLVVTATVIAFYSLDVLLARALFPPAVAGQYAVASLLGKGILFGVVPITRVMFPFATGAPLGSPARRRVLTMTLAILAACIAPALLLVAAFPLALVRVAGGPDYGGAAAIALLVTSAMGLVALSNTLLLFRLAAGVPRGWAALPALLLLEAALLLANRGSLVGFAWAVLIASGAFLCTSVVVASQPPPKAEAAPVASPPPLHSRAPSSPPGPRR